VKIERETSMRRIRSGGISKGREKGTGTDG
jgi:hypothetical protein